MVPKTLHTSDSTVIHARQPNRTSEEAPGNQQRSSGLVKWVPGLGFRV